MADRLKNQGYDVDADVDGYTQPSTINGYRPDVIAVKDGKTKIIEIETPDSVDSTRDKKQQNAFRKAADKNSDTSFQRYVTRR